jgi:hypothetical protein
VGDKPVARSLPKHRTTQTQNKCIHTPKHPCRVGFEPTIQASERAKANDVLDRTATVAGFLEVTPVLQCVFSVSYSH